MRILVLGLIFVASVNLVAGDVLIRAFQDAIRDRTAIIERVAD